MVRHVGSERDVVEGAVGGVGNDSGCRAGLVRIVGTGKGWTRHGLSGMEWIEVGCRGGVVWFGSESRGRRGMGCRKGLGSGGQVWRGAGSGCQNRVGVAGLGMSGQVRPVADSRVGIGSIRGG